MKFTITRAQNIEAIIRMGYAITRMKTGEVIAIKTQPDGRTSAKAWRADDSGKSAFYFLFKTREKAETYCKTWLASEAKATADKLARKAEKQAKRATLNASDHYTVGDCLYASWGYDQTNIDFYQVVEVKPKTIVVRELCANSSDDGGPYGGKIAPRRYEFTARSKPITCRLNENGRCAIEGKSYMGLSKWEGKALRCSSYA